MKYTIWLVIAALASSLFSLSLYVRDATAQEKKEKFKLARPGAKNVHADEWTIALDTSLSKEDFERKLARILSQYDARLLPPDPITDMPSKNAGSHSAAIQVPEARARQIAEDEVVVEVFQIFELSPDDEFPKFPPKRLPSDFEPTREGNWPLKTAQPPPQGVKKQKPPAEDESGQISLKSNPLALSSDATTPERNMRRGRASTR